MTTGTTPNLWPEWTEEDNAVSAQVQKRIAEVYPQMGDLQDEDMRVLEDGTRQFMFCFQRGRCAMQFGNPTWENMNIEYYPDIPYEV